MNDDNALRVANLLARRARTNLSRYVPSPAPLERLIIVDLDGCISDDRHRRHLLPAPDDPEPVYDAYHEHLREDVPAASHIRALTEIANQRNAAFLFITARPESVRESTALWIEAYASEAPIRGLLMRPARLERLSSPELKLRLLVDFLCENNLQAARVCVAVDDRKDVLDVYRALGIPTVHLEVGVQTPARLEDLAEAYAQIEGAELHPVAELLYSMGDTFHERNRVYKDNATIVPKVVAALFPDGVPPGLVLGTAWHLFELMIVKLTRFANSNFTHEDSIHDIAVYAAMVQHYISVEKSTTNPEEDKPHE